MSGVYAYNSFNPIWPDGGGGGQFDNPLSDFFAIIQKVFELGSSNFLAFLTNSYSPHIRRKS